MEHNVCNTNVGGSHVVKDPEEVGRLLSLMRKIQAPVAGPRLVDFTTETRWVD